MSAVRIIGKVGLVLALAFAFLQAISWSVRSGLIFEVVKERVYVGPRYIAQNAILENGDRPIDIVVIGRPSFIASLETDAACNINRVDIAGNALGWRDLNLILQRLQTREVGTVIIEARPHLFTNLRQTWPTARFDAARIMDRSTPQLLPRDDARWAFDTMVNALKPVPSPRDISEYPEFTSNIAPIVNPRSRASRRLTRLLSNAGTDITYVQIDPTDDLVPLSLAEAIKAAETPDLNAPIVPLDAFYNDLPDCLNRVEVPTRDESALSNQRAFDQLQRQRRVWQAADSTEMLLERSVAEYPELAKNYTALIDKIEAQGFQFGDIADANAEGLKPGHVYIRYDIHNRDLWFLPTYLHVNEQRNVPSVSYLMWADSDANLDIHDSFALLQDLDGHPLHRFGLHTSPLNIIASETGLNKVAEREDLVRALDDPALSRRQVTALALEQLEATWADFTTDFPGARFVSLHGGAWDDDLKAGCEEEPCDLDIPRQTDIFNVLVDQDVPYLLTDLIKGGPVAYRTDTRGEAAILCDLANIKADNRALILLIHPYRAAVDRARYDQFDMATCQDRDQ